MRGADLLPCSGRRFHIVRLGLAPVPFSPSRRRKFGCL